MPYSVVNLYGQRMQKCRRNSITQKRKGKQMELGSPAWRRRLQEATQFWELVINRPMTPIQIMLYSNGLLIIGIICTGRAEVLGIES